MVSYVLSGKEKEVYLIFLVMGWLTKRRVGQIYSGNNDINTNPTVNRAIHNMVQKNYLKIGRRSYSWNQPLRNGKYGRRSGIYPHLNVTLKPLFEYSKQFSIIFTKKEEIFLTYILEEHLQMRIIGNVYRKFLQDFKYYRHYNPILFLTQLIVKDLFDFKKTKSHSYFEMDDISTFETALRETGLWELGKRDKESKYEKDLYWPMKDFLSNLLQKIVDIMKSIPSENNYVQILFSDLNYSDVRSVWKLGFGRYPPEQIITSPVTNEK